MRRSALVVVALLLVAQGCGDTEEAAAASSEENGRIAYTVAPGFGEYWDAYIDTVSPDGAGHRRIHKIKNDWFDDLAYSPDGRRIAFIRGYNADIWVMRADGTSPRRVVANGRHDYSLTWSPTGRQIAFARSYGEGSRDFGIFHVDVRSGEVHSFLKGITGPSDLDWSPDGRSIAFTMGGNYSDLYRLDVATSTVKRLTRTRRVYESDPDWSPEGNRLVWVRGRDVDNRYKRRMVIGDRHGEVLRTLTAGWAPAWSPDGGWIAFARTTGYETACCADEYEYHDLFKIRRDGSGFQKVLELDQENLDAMDWQPR